MIPTWQVVIRKKNEMICLKQITEHTVGPQMSWAKVDYQRAGYAWRESVTFILSCVQVFLTPWAVAYQVPLSMEFSRKRILEWVAIPFSRGSSQPRDQTWVSCIAGRFFTVWTTREAPWGNVTLTLLTQPSSNEFWTLKINEHRTASNEVPKESISFTASWALHFLGCLGYVAPLVIGRQKMMSCPSSVLSLRAVPWMVKRNNSNL